MIVLELPMTGLHPESLLCLNSPGTSLLYLQVENLEQVTFPHFLMNRKELVNMTKPKAYSSLPPTWLSARTYFNSGHSIQDQ